MITLNDFNSSTNPKVVSQQNDSHIEKIEIYITEKFDEVAINRLKQYILADLKEQDPPNTTYHLDSNVMNSLTDHIKSLGSEIQFLIKEVKEKNSLISSLIPLKMLQTKYCQANNLQISNSSSNCSQEPGRESTTSENASRKNVEEVFVEKTKMNGNGKTTSLSHSTKQGNSNTNISNRVKKIGDNISTNNRGYEGKKKMLLF